MSKDTRYLNLTELENFSKAISDKLQGRLEYKTTLPLRPAGSTTRTDWNDIINLNNPSLVGDCYLLQGTGTGDYVEVNGVKYFHDEYILCTNVVDKDDTGTLSEDITIMKFGGGAVDIDGKTILNQNDDGTYAQLHTRVGGWLDTTDVSSNTKTTTLTDTESTYTFIDTKMDGIWGVKAPAKVTVTITEKDTTTVILDMKLNIAGVAGWENTFSFSTADIGFVVTRNPGVDFTIKMIHHTAAYSKEVDVVFTVDASVIHHLDTDYIKIDKETIVSKKVLSTDEVNTLRAKSALEVDSLSGITSPLTETIYRLTTEETISGKKYAKGLYVYDITGTDPVWLAVGGSEVDEKTILSTNDDGELVPLHTEISGWKEKAGYVPSIDYGATLTGFTFKDGYWELTFDYTYGDKPGENDYVYVDYKTVNGITFTGKLDERFDMPDEYVFTYRPVTPDVSFHDIKNSTQAKIRFAATDDTDTLLTHSVITYLHTPEVIHPVKSEYIYIDEETIVKKDIKTGEETNRFRAKSAIEVNTLDITNPLTETIYRLTRQITIGTKRYAKGLYVYDITDPDNPVWLSVGGNEIDEITIVSKDITGYPIPLKAKSAIVVEKLSTISNVKDEVIYHLTKEETYRGVYYDSGFYVRYKGEWIKVGGYNFDEKTIISKEDNGSFDLVHTAVGGYFEKGFVNIKDRAGSRFSYSVDAATMDVTIEATYAYANLKFTSDCKLYVYLLWEGYLSNAMSVVATYIYDETEQKFINISRATDVITTSVTVTGENYISANIKNFAVGPETPDKIEFYIYKGDSADSTTVRESDSRFVNIDNKTLIRAGKDRFGNEVIRTSLTGYREDIEIGAPIYGIAYADIVNLNGIDYFTMFVDPEFKLTNDLEGQTFGVKVYVNGNDPIYERGTIIKVSDTEYYFDTDTYKIILYMNAGFVDARFYMKDSSTITADYMSVSVYEIMGAVGASGVVHQIHPKYIPADNLSIEMNNVNGSLFANGIIDEVPNSYRQNWIYRQSDPFEYGGVTYPAGIYTLKNNVLTRLDATVSVDEETIISKDPDGKNIPLRTELGGRIIKSGTSKSWPDSRTMEYDADMKMWTYDSTPYGEPEPIDFSLLSERIPFKSYVELIVTDETDPSYSKTKLIPLRCAEGTDSNVDYCFIDENECLDKFRAAVVIMFDEKDKHIHEIMAYMYEPDTTVSSHTVKCTFKFYEYNYLSIAHPEFIPIDNKTLKLFHNELGETPNYFTTSIGGYIDENSTAVTYVMEDKYISNTGTSSAHPGYTYFEISNAIPNNLLTSLSNNKKATLTNLRIRQTGLISNQIIFKHYITFKSNNIFGWNVQIGSSDTVLHPAILELYTTNIIRLYVKDDDTEIDPTIGITLTVTGIRVEEVETTYHPIESKCINVDNITLINDTTGSGETGLLRAKSAIETSKLSTITSPLTETMYRLTADETIGTTTYKAGLYVYDKTTSKWTAVGGGDEVKIDDLTIIKDTTTGKIKTSIGGYVSTDSYETKKYDIPTITLSESANMHIRFDNNMEYILNAGKNIQANISAVDDSYNPVSTGLKEYIYNSAEKSWTYSDSDFIAAIDYVSSSNFIVSISSSSSKNVSEFFNTSGAGISEVSNILITPISNTVYSPIESRCIKCKTDGGITTSADGIAIKVNTSSGLKTDESSGLTFNFGTGLIMDSGFIKVYPNANKAIVVENEGVGIKLNTNTTDVGTSGDSGLQITANGIFAKHNIYYGTAAPTASNYKVGDIYIQY